MKPIFFILFALHFISAKHHKNNKSLITDLNFCHKFFERGFESANCYEIPESLLLEIPEKFHQICSTTFTLACFNSTEKFSCEKGKNHAKARKECNSEHHSYVFKKCCNACKLGIEIQHLENCNHFPSHLDNEIIKMAHKCCKLEEKFPTIDFENFQELKVKENEVSGGEEIFREISLNTIDQEIEREAFYTTLNYEEKPVEFSQICSKYLALCNENEICIDTKDSYKCECKENFYRNRQTSECEDIDECANRDLNKCEDFEICINEIGSYSCEAFKCPKGFQILINSTIGHDVECVDIDECEKNPCDEGKVCKNHEGGFECDSYDVLKQHCVEGYEMVADECVDINECSVEGICEDGVCTNLKGGFRCEKILCDSGYSMMSFSRSTCQRNLCGRYDKNCLKKPQYISNFFKVINSNDKNRRIATMHALKFQSYTNYRLVQFDDKHFNLNFRKNIAEIYLVSIPKHDVELKVELEIKDTIGKYRKTHLNVYHIYIEDI